MVVWEVEEGMWLHVRKVCLHEEGKIGGSDTMKNVKKGNPAVFTPYRAAQYPVLS